MIRTGNYRLAARSAVLGVCATLSCRAQRAGLLEPLPHEAAAQAREDAERARRKAEAESRKFFASLRWSEWGENNGLKMRFGVPEQVRIGEVFDAGVEIAPIPGKLSPDACVVRRWFTVGVAMEAAQGERQFPLREWTMGSGPFVHSIPYFPPVDEDFSKRTTPLLWRLKYILPRSSGAVGGEATLCATLRRGPEAANMVHSEKGVERPWIGSITTPPMKVKLLAS